MEPQQAAGNCLTLLRFKQINVFLKPGTERIRKFRCAVMNHALKKFSFSASALMLLLLVLGGSCQKSGSIREPGQTSSPAEGSKMSKIEAGSWGGQHISMDVGDQGITIEFDCAHGAIDRQFETDESGAFEVIGTYVKESPGPVRQGEESDAQPARYRGRIDGNEMNVTITLTGTDEVIGTFTLTHGKAPRVFKCG